ncbi:MAG: hypothetical protein MHPSP_001645, partial [Paramarteilia canceri]
ISKKIWNKGNDEDYTSQNSTLKIGDSCVGSQIQFGENVTINNSVLFDKCKIGSSVYISNSIICENVTISDGYFLK